MNKLEDQFEWLKAYQAETARYGLEAINIGREMVSMLNTVNQYGGWDKFKKDHPDIYREFETKWSAVTFRVVSQFEFH